MPELVEQAVWDILDRVFATGKPFFAKEFAARFEGDDGGPGDDKVFNWVAQPTHDEQGRIDGVMVFAVEVTEQAAARARSSRPGDGTRAAARR